MQLLANGSQDIYLTGNPMITYFKVIYRRHTNFSSESILQTFNGIADFGSTVTAILSRGGDLIHGMFLEATLPDLQFSSPGQAIDLEILRWTDDIGHHLIQSVSIDIGGQVVDTHFGDWLEIWAQLTLPAGKISGYRELIGQDVRTPLGLNTGLQSDVYCGGNETAIPGRTIYVPLQFWFCRNVGLALPLIALQYHEVRVNVTLRRFADLIISLSCTDITGQTPVNHNRTPTGHLSNVNLWADYIYLDTDERRRFAQVAHEYLIEQLQYTGEQTSILGAPLNIKLDLNHPVKELIWVGQHQTAIQSNQWSNYTSISPVITSVGLNGLPTDLASLGAITSDTMTTAPTDINNMRVFGNQEFCKPPGGGNVISTASLFINGNLRFATREGPYYNWKQCMDHHTNVPRSPGINVYSFALRPEQHQPGGSCNFSRVDSAHLYLTFVPGKKAQGSNHTVAFDFSNDHIKVRVYATNYNIMRVMSGMAGVAYSQS